MSLPFRIIKSGIFLDQCIHLRVKTPWGDYPEKNLCSESENSSMDMNWFVELNPVMQAFLAGCFTWVLTALGAGAVFLTWKVPDALVDSMLGFAAGVMIAASFWSLLAPSIEVSEAMGKIAWIPAAIGFVSGGLFLRLADYLLPHLHPFQPMSEAEGIHTHWQRATLLVLAITLHNIPEGLAIGVAYGAIGVGSDFVLSGDMAGAIALTLGIGLQNFPEGIAVAMPLRSTNVSRIKSFNYGQLSAVVEPIAAVLGAWLVMSVQPLLPYALAFAAGAMIYVVVEELIPEAQAKGRTDLATFSTIIGFTIMMILDISLG